MYLNQKSVRKWITVFSKQGQGKNKQMFVVKKGLFDFLEHFQMHPFYQP